MPILSTNSMELISRSPEQTRRVGMRLGALLAPGDLVCLVGDLGSGKTTLVQGIAAGWGSLDNASSPTFVLLNVYRRLDQKCLYHLDAYRLSGALEAEDLDLIPILEAGPMVVEWAERIQGALPPECLWIKLHWVLENQRDFLFQARGVHYESLLALFRKHTFGG
jgi:tRNA threonylcarbamoyladenosine biosynthesis protein TsaE